MKKEIKIYVDGQEIRLEQSGAIVRGSKGYLQCRFSFSDGWQKMKKVAVFSDGYGFKKEYAVPITGDVCHIPDAVTDGRRIYIKVVGMKENVVITTRVCALDQEG